uniref:DUF834 domain-containing protein n=1 Tax=Oryza meridionalis TaxID=40149 RepID=A0A0E0EWM5_9ORYZ
MARGGVARRNGGARLRPAATSQRRRAAASRRQRRGRARGRGGGTSPTTIDDGERRRAMTAAGRAPGSPKESKGRERDHGWLGRRPWRSSPACGANGVPAAENGGEEADDVAFGLANPTAAMARLGTAASGDRSGGGGGGEADDGARVEEGTRELGEMVKKREGGAVVVYIASRGSIVAEIAAISPAKWKRWGGEREAGFENRIPAVLSAGAGAGGEVGRWLQGVREREGVGAGALEKWRRGRGRAEEAGAAVAGARCRPEVGDGPDRWGPPIGDPMGGGAWAADCWA